MLLGPVKLIPFLPRGIAPYIDIWYTWRMIERIHSPTDIKPLSIPEMEALAKEIRQTLIDTVSETGGHLASNLGAVELTLALHRVFDAPTDKIIFDVGHQSYTHKILTGRAEALPTLRAEGGLSGFPKRAESEYDAFETGHASTAISAALGFARARDLLQKNYAVVALVGDGALTGGLCYEALNDAGSRPTQLVVLLNDNEMSIAPNVGALSHYLTRLRGSRHWIGTKGLVKRGLHRIPWVGEWIAGMVEKIKRTLKLLLVPGEFFEALGLQYLGPIDGHDIEMLERALRDARGMGLPVVVHAVTQKGRGYAIAERRPEAFHGVAPFLVENGRSKELADGELRSACKVVEETLCAQAEKNPNVVAITAAMPQGTGLVSFSERWKDRFFDVGIAEAHAATLAAGLAIAGLRPVFAVYATFSQRAADQILHDICLQKANVLILLDHAGFVPGDGATHQGVYDLGIFRSMPDLLALSPCDARELSQMIAFALTRSGPCVIRYPKSLPRQLGDDDFSMRWRCLSEGGEIAVIAHGQAVPLAIEVQNYLKASNKACAVYSASVLNPLDEETLSDIAHQYALIATLETDQLATGLGVEVAARLARMFGGSRGSSSATNSLASGGFSTDSLGGKRSAGPLVLNFGVPGIAPQSHSMAGLLRECRLDAQSVAEKIEIDFANMISPDSMGKT